VVDNELVVKDNAKIFYAEDIWHSFSIGDFCRSINEKTRRCAVV
jgi:hypothetical protein